ncbi:sugar ABC transporter substrate-binding protein [Microbacterium tumbae]
MALAGTLAMGLAMSGCAGSAESDEDVTLTYWATNQGPSIPADEEILTAELDKFTEQTGIEVDLEVIGWPDINNRILAAASTGRGPDVLNFGNTNAYMFGSTGALMELDEAALDAIGGRDRYIPAVFGTSDLDPITSVPLYSQVYGLFYNKKMFADAGLEPPTTWQEFRDAAEALTDPATDTYGFTFPGASISTTMHMLYVYGRQNGGTPFDDDSAPTFTTEGMVAGADQLVDVFRSGVVNPAAVQYINGGDSANDFAQGRAAMVFLQSGSIATILAGGMTTDDFGVVPLPVLDPLPSGGDPVTSMIAGTNIAVFDSTDHKDAALELVKFMTSPEELEILDKAYQVLPVLKDSPLDFMEYEDAAQTFVDILEDGAQPLPVTGDNNSFQTNAGGAMTQIFGRVSTGETVTIDDIRTALSDAQDQMPVQ